MQSILDSETFKGAATLQQLFRFLADQTFRGHPGDIKEYAIGIDVLGRKQDFDPKTDPIVRVQMHRLRHKLKEYYESEGAQDSICVELPRGSYCLKFQPVPPSTRLSSDINLTRQPSVLPKVQAPDVPAVSDQAVQRGRTAPRSLADLRKPMLLAAVVGILSFLVGVWLAHDWGTRGNLAGKQVSEQVATDPVIAFWSRILANDSRPIIAYANAVFLLDESDDMFRLRAGANDNRGTYVDPHLALQNASNPALVARAGQLYYENGYTGTGELNAVGKLIELFTKMGKQAAIKSSRDITADDLQQHTVIFLGSSSQNPAVAQLPVAGDLRFVDADSRHELWADQIANSHPYASEQKTYRTERDPNSGVLKSDYSLFTVQPGLGSENFIVIMAGLDTKGTEGSATFATSPLGIGELNRASHDAGLDEAKKFRVGFQTLIQVRLQKGYQVLDSRMIGFHPFSAKTANAEQRASANLH